MLRLPSAGRAPTVRGALAALSAILIGLSAGPRPARAESPPLPPGEISAITSALESPLAVEVAGARAACEWQGDEAGVRLPVIVSLGPEEIGDPASIAPVVDCAADRHLAIIVRIEPPVDWESAPNPYLAIQPWLSRLERLVQASRGKFSAIVLGHRPDLSLDPVGYAYLVEKAATLIRSLGANTALVIGDLSGQSWEWFDRIPAARLQPYAGGIVLSDERAFESWRPKLARKLPGLPVWVQGGSDLGADEILREYHAARALGAAMFLASAQAEDAGRILASLVRRLPLRFLPDAEPEVVAIHEPGAAGPESFFADPLGPERAVILPSTTKGTSERISIGPDPIQTLRAYDLGTGEEIPLRVVTGGPESAPLVLDLAGTGAPLLVRYVARAAPRAEPETVSVVSGYELSAEEIVARLRAFEAAEARRLHNYTARATLSYHYRAEALNESISVASVNRFYWKDGVGEYEELELYVNGARWRGTPPSLPFIQPEKVKEVPIEIRLDASYVYKRTGRDKVNGRPSYVLSFEPAEGTGSLYSGQAWIDEQTFALNKIRLVQNDTKAPITSSSDVLEYGWVEGKEHRHWLPIKGYRQMVFTALGRSVAVEREVAYEDFAVNEDGFDSSRQEAYASSRPIIREDADGLAYMKRDGSGGRVRQGGDSLRNVAIVGGFSLDAGFHPGSPFAGINYFDFDYRHTGTQVDIAFAGPFLDGAWTDPSLGGSRWELTFETLAIGVRQGLKRATNVRSVKDEELDFLEEHAFMVLARPLTSYSKAEFHLDMQYEDFDSVDRTDPRMVVPTSAWTATTTGRYKYYRSGFLADLWASASQRYGWEDWGLPGGLQGSASQDSFQRWGLSLTKSFYPGPLHKISFSGGVSAGRNLDRLSRFRVGDFGNARVHGFNGSDITFDRGAAAQASYLVTLPRGGMSLEFSLDGAVVEDPEDFGFEEVSDPNGVKILVRQPGANQREYLTGAALAVAFSGPWGTLMRVGAAQRLWSSFDRASLDTSLRFTIIKTYPEWPWKRKKPALPPAAPSTP